MLGTALVLVLVAGLAGASAVAAAPTDRPSSSKLGVGVTADKIKIGVALVDFESIKDFTDSFRENEQEVYQAFVDDINAKGGIAGRKLEPVYELYRPLGSAPALAVCTKFTDDDKVFAVLGTLVDFSGDAQSCVAKQHERVLVTFNLTQQIIDKAPGLMIYPGATNERTAKVVLQLLKEKKTLKGKKVAALGGAAQASVVKDVIVPGLKKMGVQTGTTAILGINGTADTTSAQAQLDSFIEKWKGEGVNAIFLSGDEVSSEQFVTKIKQEIPKALLITDTTDVRDFGRNLVSAGVKPNPYEGILSASGPTPAEYDKSDNWKYCADIYEKYTGKHAPNAEEVVKNSDGQVLETNGSINDACQQLTVFHDIAERVGKNLNNANWVRAVNTFGDITNRGSGPYSSLHKGKYDIEDSFHLVAFDSSIGDRGSWRAVTPLKDVSGG